MSAPPPIPKSVADIDAAWLTALLRHLALLGDGEVKGWTRAATAGVAVTSEILRLHLELEGASPATPRRLVIKVPREGARDWSALHRREVRFYRALAPMGLPIPEAIYAAEDDGAFVLVLTDLGDVEHCLDGVRGAEARMAFRTLGALHARTRGHTLLAKWPEKAWSPAHADDVAERFRETWPALVRSASYQVEPLLVAKAERLADLLGDDLARLSCNRSCLIHSDLHVENFVFANGEMVILDWQNAAVGNPAVDLGALIASVHPAEMHRWEEWLEAYREGGGEPILGDVQSAVRWYFATVAYWLVAFEAESLRDVTTVQPHWLRLQAALHVLG